MHLKAKTTTNAALLTGALLLGTALSMLIATTASTQAANVSMNVSDVLAGNESSLDTNLDNGNHWNNGSIPSAANDYFTANFVLRTPANGNSLTFAGNSLTVNNTNGSLNGGLWYKGSGTTGIYTIDNLNLNGGSITHQSSNTSLFQIAGNLHVAANSQIHARQGPIDISAVVSGVGTITNPGSDCSTCTLTLSSPSNTFSGNLVNNGRFELGNGAAMNFVVGANGINNSISGSGAQTILQGNFLLDLTAASTTTGDTWSLVTAANVSYGSSFSIVGFTQAGNVWKSGNYQFSEATGILSVAATAGDVNGDGNVDDTDYQTILTHFQMTVTTREEGDLTGDGIVNLSDFAEWRLAKEALIAASEVRVPEPLSALQLLLALSGCQAFARRLRIRPIRGCLP